MCLLGLNSTGASKKHTECLPPCLPEEEDLAVISHCCPQWQYLNTSTFLNSVHFRLHCRESPEDTTWTTLNVLAMGHPSLEQSECGLTRSRAMYLWLQPQVAEGMSEQIPKILTAIRNIYQTIIFLQALLFFFNSVSIKK